MSDNKQMRLTDRWRRDTGIKLIDDEGNEENFTRKDGKKAPDEIDDIEEIEED